MLQESSRYKLWIIHNLLTQNFEIDKLWIYSKIQL